MNTTHICKKEAVIKELQDEINKLKIEVEVEKNNIKAVKEDISDMKADIKEVKTSLTTMQENMGRRFDNNRNINLTLLGGIVLTLIGVIASIAMK